MIYQRRPPKPSLNPKGSPCSSLKGSKKTAEIGCTALQKRLTVSKDIEPNSYNSVYNQGKNGTFIYANSSQNSSVFEISTQKPIKLTGIEEHLQEPDSNQQIPHYQSATDTPSLLISVLRKERGQKSKKHKGPFRKQESRRRPIESINIQTHTTSTTITNITTISPNKKIVPDKSHTPSRSRSKSAASNPIHSKDKLKRPTNKTTQMTDSHNHFTGTKTNQPHQNFRKARYVTEVVCGKDNNRSPMSTLQYKSSERPTNKPTHPTTKKNHHERSADQYKSPSVEKYYKKYPNKSLEKPTTSFKKSIDSKTNNKTASKSFGNVSQMNGKCQNRKRSVSQTNSNAFKTYFSSTNTVTPCHYSRSEGQSLQATMSVLQKFVTTHIRDLSSIISDIGMNDSPTAERKPLSKAYYTQPEESFFNNKIGSKSHNWHENSIEQHYQLGSTETKNIKYRPTHNARQQINLHRIDEQQTSCLENRLKKMFEVQNYAAIMIQRAWRAHRTQQLVKRNLYFNRKGNRMGNNIRKLSGSFVSSLLPLVSQSSVIATFNPNQFQKNLRMCTKKKPERQSEDYKQLVIDDEEKFIYKESEDDETVQAESITLKSISSAKRQFNLNQKQENCQAIKETISISFQQCLQQGNSRKGKIYPTNTKKPQQRTLDSEFKDKQVNQLCNFGSIISKYEANLINRVQMISEVRALVRNTQNGGAERVREAIEVMMQVIQNTQTHKNNKMGLGCLTNLLSGNRKPIYKQPSQWLLSVNQLQSHKLHSTQQQFRKQHILNGNERMIEKPHQLNFQNNKIANKAEVYPFPENQDSPQLHLYEGLWYPEQDQESAGECQQVKESQNKIYEQAKINSCQKGNEMDWEDNLLFHLKEQCLLYQNYQRQQEEVMKLSNQGRPIVKQDRFNKEDESIKETTGTEITVNSVFNEQLKALESIYAITDKKTPNGEYQQKSIDKVINLKGTKDSNAQQRLYLFCLNEVMIEDYLHSLYWYLNSKLPQKLQQRLKTPCGPQAKDVLIYCRGYWSSIFEETQSNLDEGQQSQELQQTQFPQNCPSLTSPDFLPQYQEEIRDIIPDEEFNEHWLMYQTYLTERFVGQPANSNAYQKNSQEEKIGTSNPTIGQEKATKSNPYIHLYRFFFRCLFDCLNECIDHFRPWGLYGKPFPWICRLDSQLREVHRTAELNESNDILPQKNGRFCSMKIPENCRLPPNSSFYSVPCSNQFAAGAQIPNMIPREFHKAMHRLMSLSTYYCGIVTTDTYQKLGGILNRSQSNCSLQIQTPAKTPSNLNGLIQGSLPSVVSPIANEFYLACLVNNKLVDEINQDRLQEMLYCDSMELEKLWLFLEDEYTFGLVELGEGVVQELIIEFVIEMWESRARGVLSASKKL